jgi:hypothetical protein
MGVVRRGSKWAIRYYGPDGRQRWETIGPNKREAETVFAQRIYEVRSGKFPILQRRKRLLFRDFADEWQEKHLSVYASRPPTSTSACFAIISCPLSVSDLSHGGRART